jgi:hypothetical protein
MTPRQFRISISVITIIALAEIVVGLFYYYVFFIPKKEMEDIRVQEEVDLAAKKLEQERLLEEAKLKAQTRLEEIKLEVKEIDLELARIARWEEAGEQFEALREEEEKKKGKEASLVSCMKIVVENYHNQWNKRCEEKNLPNSCYLSEEDSQVINADYEVGKKQCDDFFATSN